MPALLADKNRKFIYVEQATNFLFLKFLETLYKLYTETENDENYLVFV